MPLRQLNGSGSDWIWRFKQVAVVAATEEQAGGAELPIAPLRQAADDGIPVAPVVDAAEHAALLQGHELGAADVPEAAISYSAAAHHPLGGLPMAVPVARLAQDWTPPPAQHPPPPPPVGSSAQRLEAVADFHRQGVLTDGQFAAARDQLRLAMAQPAEAGAVGPGA